MNIECIVSCLIVVKVDVPESISDAMLEAMAKHEFFCNIAKMNPDNLSVEILDKN